MSGNDDVIKEAAAFFIRLVEARYWNEKVP